MGVRHARRVDPDAAWMPIAGFPDYEVSSDGRVRSFRSGSIPVLRPNANSGGYLSVSMTDESGARQYRLVHRLVAEAFLPRPAGCDVVMHIDNNKQNNRADNLSWATAQINSLHACFHGLRARPTRAKVKRGAKELQAFMRSVW